MALTYARGYYTSGVPTPAAMSSNFYLGGASALFTSTSIDLANWDFNNLATPLYPYGTFKYKGAPTITELSIKYNCTITRPVYNYGTSTGSGYIVFTQLYGNGTSVMTPINEEYIYPNNEIVTSVIEGSMTIRSVPTNSTFALNCFSPSMVNPIKVVGNPLSGQILYANYEIKQIS